MESIVEKFSDTIKRDQKNLSNTIKDNIVNKDKLEIKALVNKITQHSQHVIENI